MNLFPLLLLMRREVVIFALTIHLRKMRMMKYPIGIQSFDQIIEGNWVYVDKTDLVYRLVTTTKTCFS